jgi:hypothetical protein
MATIVGLFETREEAKRAIEALRRAGLGDSDITQCASLWALPFLSARRVEKGLQAAGHLADLSDRPTDRFGRSIQVQDQAIP